MREGEVIAGRFELLRLAGTGGMAQVYQARDRQGGGLVAVKITTGADGDETRRFLREAQVLADLSHPSVVRYVAHGSTAAECYMAMEWLEGEDLAQRLRRGPLGYADTIRLGERVGDALGAAHARGVVHRDIKPSNLYLPAGDVDRVKLIDFGIAALEGTTRRLTRTGMTMGTPGYMSPEQARGERTVGARTDVFALGCVLFECAAGRPVFQASHPMAVLGMILFEEPPRLRSLRPDAPPELDELLARLLVKVEADRLPDGAAVAAALAALPAVNQGAGRAGQVPGAPEASVRTAALTLNELRFVSVVLASTGALTTGSSPTVPLAPGSPWQSLQSPTEALRDAARRHGARVEMLADGSVLAVLPASDAPTEQAMRAARCALAMRAALPGYPMVLASGRGVVESRGPVGEVIDRAARALAGAPANVVRIDEMTAGLLDTRFDVATSASGSELRAERTGPATIRTLLGKPTPFLGRDRELSLLASTFRECASDGFSHAVLITGAAGIGKSRLAHEFVRGLEASGEPVEVFRVRGDPLSAGSAFAMLAPGLRRRAGIFEGEPIGDARRKLRTMTDRRLPPEQADSIAKFLGEMLGVPSDDEDNFELRAAREDAVMMGQRVRSAWEAWLAAICASRPLLIVLEDLHFGDLPTVEACDGALRSLRDAPFMVLGLARPEVHERFPRLWEARNLVEVRLSALHRRASERLVREVLADRADEAQVAEVVERADGNALYLEELIRAVAEGHGASLPDTVLGMMQARFDALHVDARRVLRAASVFGHSFWRGGVEALIGDEGGSVTVAEWLEELTARELVVRRDRAAFPDEVEYTFRNGTVREAAYAMLTAADCALGHRLAGTWLVARRERDARVLAEHFQRGGDRTGAVPWHRGAAEQALDANDFDAAISAAEQAIGSGASGDELGAARLIQATASSCRGRFAAAAEQALEAITTLEPGSAAWCRAHAELVYTSGALGRPGAADSAAALRAHPPAPAATAAWAVAMCRAANQLALGGERDVAAAIVDEAAARAPAGDEVVLARLHQARGFVMVCTDRLEESLIAHRTSAELFEKSGHRERLAAWNHVAFLYLELGQHAAAEHLLRETLAATERIGLTHAAALARINLSVALLRQGRTEDARITGIHSAAPAAIEDRRSAGLSRCQIGELLALAGDLPGAAREFDQAASVLAPFPPLQARALGLLAQVRLARGDAAAALAAASRGMEVIGRLGAILLGESLLRLAHARALHAVGDVTAARAAIGSARDLLLARAARLSEPAARDTFLTAVAENAETLALADAWS